jgi:hypothetical protein
MSDFSVSVKQSILNIHDDPVSARYVDKLLDDDTSNVCRVFLRRNMKPRLRKRSNEETERQQTSLATQSESMFPHHDIPFYTVIKNKPFLERNLRYQIRKRNLLKRRENLIETKFATTATSNIHMMKTKYQQQQQQQQYRVHFIQRETNIKVNTTTTSWLCPRYYCPLCYTFNGVWENLFDENFICLRMTMSQFC